MVGAAHTAAAEAVVERVCLAEAEVAEPRMGMIAPMSVALAEAVLRVGKLPIPPCRPFPEQSNTS